MLDISIVNKTSQEANWNGQTGRQAGRKADGQDHALSQADPLTKKWRDAPYNTNSSSKENHKYYVSYVAHFQCKDS